ncbi:MAG: DUF3465 domain-containing protein [Pseudomonadota bacterium]
MPKTVIGALLLVAGAVFTVLENGGLSMGNGDSGAGGSGDGLTVESLFAAQRSDTWLTVDGRVDRILSDDNEGSRHQRFIMRTASGHTVLVAHNIDLAPRVAGIREDDPIRVYGEYEWNDRGGVVHWTHHDPDGGIPGGWVEHRGERYR